MQVEARVKAAVESVGGQLSAHWANTLHHLEDLPFPLAQLPQTFGGWWWGGGCGGGGGGGDGDGGGPSVGTPPAAAPDLWWVVVGWVVVAVMVMVAVVVMVAVLLLPRAPAVHSTGWLAPQVRTWRWCLMLDDAPTCADLR